MALVSSYVFSVLREFCNNCVLMDSDSGEVLTGRDVIERSLRISRFLEARGFGSGDTIAYFSANCADFVSFTLGIVHTGAALCFGHPKFTHYELDTFLDMVSPACVIYNPHSCDWVRLASPSAAGRCFSTSEVMAEPSAPELGDAEQKLADSREHVAVVFLSSGTSGFPKAAMVSHHAMLLNLKHGFHFNKENQKMLAVLPMCHIFGLLCTLDILCTRSSSIVTMSKFSSRALTAAIKEYQITFLPIVPSLFSALIQSEAEDLRSLRLIFTGGSPFNQDLLTRFLKGFPPDSLEIHNIYGMTEIGIISQAPVRGRQETAAVGEFVGSPLDILQAKIVDTANQTQIRALGETGELWLRGETVFLGYKSNPRATEDMLDAEGWLHTGDLAYQTSDGSYFIVGRIKEMIKYQGNQISPYELESIFRRHAQVQDAAVIGLPHHVLGELPAALVEPKAAAHVDTEALKLFVEAHISPNKRLRGGVCLCGADYVPRTLSGKVKRQELLRKVLRSMQTQKRFLLTDLVLTDQSVDTKNDASTFKTQ